MAEYVKPFIVDDGGGADPLGVVIALPDVAYVAEAVETSVVVEAALALETVLFVHESVFLAEQIVTSPAK